MIDVPLQVFILSIFFPHNYNQVNTRVVNNAQHEVYTHKILVDIPHFQRSFTQRIELII